MSFRIWAICLVKNEVDIVEYCLREASSWCDGIFVFDNGSSDGTWEKVRSLSNDVIIPWQSRALPFRESLRREPFEAFRHLSATGDWWCRLDADEFYVQSPRQHLARIRPSDHVVFGVSLQYYLTPEELSTIDFHAPVAAVLPRIRHYRAETTEPRFFRYRPRLHWGNQGWPDHMGPVSPDRILYRHYKYRSPEQIRNRLRTRQEAIRQGFRGWEHATSANWQDKVMDPASLHVDAGDGHYAIDWSTIPNHEDSLIRRSVKRFMHVTGLWP